MTTIRELFLIAVHGESKAERHNAFCQLREIATRGVGEEAEEAKRALSHSLEYEQEVAAQLLEPSARLTVNERRAA